MSNLWKKTVSVSGVITSLWAAFGLISLTGSQTVSSAPKDSVESIAGSSSCRQCHENFYTLWSSSFHGLAMQPYSDAFAQQSLQPQKTRIAIGNSSYQAFVGKGQGWVTETNAGGEKKLPILHVLGGKNVYYFLTALDKGRLQTLPVAFDVHKKEWFDTAASGVRHFVDRPDAPIHWTERAYTFNTACYGCHVSQLKVNYDFAADTYNTVWAEPGINCETCHGPAQEHNRLFLETEKGKTPPDPKIISTKKFTVEQTNSLCAPCHAKMLPITAGFTPGQRYFDHYDLVTLDNPDFYPDGRDLGENYTYTSWRMSPCVKSGQLDCMHCHTSSGRFRQKDNPNQACAPCHQDKVDNPHPHTHHDGKYNVTCIACHMPMTEFARMRRSDHSMRPPTPAATIAYQSPNACNLCHTNKDAAWADKAVRKWHKDDYQKPTLETARLMAMAKRNDFSALPDILSYIARSDRDEITAASFIRLLANCSSDTKWPTLIRALQNDPSPLVRAAAADALDGHLTEESTPVLLKALADDFRLVRIRAASSLAYLNPAQITKPQDRQAFQTATAELSTAFTARPDDAASYFNYGNWYNKQQNPAQAVKHYETAIRLWPDFILAYVNASMAYNQLGQNDAAEKCLRETLNRDPNNLPANLNLALLLGEMNNLDEAQTLYRKVFQLDPHSAVAAYNLGILLAEKNPADSLAWCKTAWQLRPGDPKYGYTYAYYLLENGRMQEAIDTLTIMIDGKTSYASAYALLAETYLNQNRIDKAIDVFCQAADNPNLSAQDKMNFKMRLEQLAKNGVPQK